ncbi:hypothetical protein F5882DRAFT_445515 [Hyaloscypha sp. PMI_1271]|nr:hypothetical protein F5882DRAFT_445515 [Hyaloscypha sp. PMI_1271]
MCMKLCLGLFVMKLSLEGCGRGLFLNPLIIRSPVYGEIVERLKKGEKSFLSPIAHLSRVFEGVLSEDLYAVDIASHWDVGYTMLNDREHFRAQFIETDILHPSPSFTALNSSVDTIWASKVLHQWD